MSNAAFGIAMARAADRAEDARRREAERDAERLDWLDQRLTGDFNGGLADVWPLIGLNPKRATLRDAIDEAMAEP